MLSVSTTLYSLPVISSESVTLAVILFVPLIVLPLVFLLRSHLIVSADGIEGLACHKSGFAVSLLGRRKSVNYGQIDWSRSLQVVPGTPVKSCVIRSTDGHVIWVPNFIDRERYDEMTELIKTWKGQG
jgi:hypothetical protein